MKTIESLSTSELENWLKGNAPSGDIIELERAAVQYACRVELYSRPGGCNRADRPTHEAELILGDKEEEIEELESQIRDLKGDVSDEEERTEKANEDLGKANQQITELKDKLQVAATQIDELKSKLIGKE